MYKLRKLFLPKISESIVGKNIGIDGIFIFVYEIWKTLIFFSILGFVITIVYIVAKEDKYVSEINIIFRSSAANLNLLDDKNWNLNDSLNRRDKDSLNVRKRSGVSQGDFREMLYGISDYAQRQIKLHPNNDKDLSKFMNKDYLNKFIIIDGYDSKQNKISNTSLEEPLGKVLVIDSGGSSSEASLKVVKSANFISRFISYWAYVNYLQNLDNYAELMFSDFELRRIRAEHQIAELNQKILFLTRLREKYSFALTGSFYALDPKDASSKYYNIGSQLVAANVEKEELSVSLDILKRGNEQVSVYKYFINECKVALSKNNLENHPNFEGCASIVASKDVFSTFSNKVLELPLLKIKQDLYLLDLNYVDGIKISSVPNTYKKVGYRVFILGLIFGLFVGLIYCYILCFFRVYLQNNVARF